MSAPSALQDAYGSNVPQGREVARGRHANLYLCADSSLPPQLLKVYLSPPTSTQARKVEGMVSQTAPPRIPSRVLWPTAPLYGSNRQLAGLVTPLPPEGLSHVAGLRALLVPELRRQQFPQADWRFRVQVGERLAQAFGDLHACGHLMGDVRPEHVLVTDAGEVWLVGSDDYQLQLGEQVMTPLPSSAEYTPAEAQRQGTDTLVPRLHQPGEDFFGLAVLLFELLLERHPYAGVQVRGPAPGPVAAIAAGQFVDAASPPPGLRAVPGSLPFAALSPEVQALFERAFVAGHADPQARPSPQEWASALREMAAALHPCEQQPQHLRVRGQPCPECVAAQQRPTEFDDDDTSVADRVEKLWSDIMRVASPPPSPTIAPVTEAPPLPSLKLGLPSRPKGMGHAQLERLIAWVLRALVLAVLMLAVWLVQRSFLALLVVPGIILFALTLGRSFVVDWDGLIDRYEAWEKGLVRQLIPTGGQHQVYRQAVLARREEVKNELSALLARREELRERYQRENAGATFLRSHMELEQRRNRLRDLGRGGGLRALYTRWYERSEREFLALQALRSGGVPGVGPRELSLAVARGIRNAGEIEPDRLGTLPAPFARELMAWRQGLQDFFQFDPAQIPRGEINELQRHGEQQARAELQEFEEAVRAFSKTRWDRNEAEISRELGIVQRQIEQHRRALKKLKKIEV
ncbi:MAG: helix-hairpin-helix domain-containing protein [Deinococcus sp.]|uniref:helix-hairpin-helix domain-containing protein n=1 Tax=Deinococcus sp. TaxID=47478 RepID=UPI0026DCB6A2|nr:helix-hairpin-helix domain-containing protein [Deinococcus sp.]MDO4246714.1 helix-hairpin-helix domain-containing protein [Deinococcus sp.]